MRVTVFVSGFTIFLARAIYSKRELLVLDEATSALDEEIEEKVLKNLIRSNKQNTIILISHRATLLKYCEKFFKIKKCYSLKNLVIELKKNLMLLKLL